MISAGDFSPGRLWSLWNLMHKIDSAKLLEIFQTLCACGQNLMDVLVIPNAIGPNRTLQYSMRALDDLKQKVEYLRDIATEIELPALAATANRLVATLADPQPPIKRKGRIGFD